MNLQERISVCVELGKKLSSEILNNQRLLVKSTGANGWFTEDEVERALINWSDALSADKIEKWLSDYPELTSYKAKNRVGIIMAGNIPLVGLHDLISVFLSGNVAVVKMSSDDEVLMSEVIMQLLQLDERVGDYIEVAQRMKNFDAVIATGSNNTSRYFDAYFGKYPHIIRRNRTSVAILTGSESSEELKELGKDIFQYFGLGCRNVTKLFVPKGYSFNLFFESIVDFGYVLDNIKYTHNYDYHKTLFLLNSEELLDNEFLLLKEDTKLKSPIGVLHYEYYEGGIEQIVSDLEQNANVQCVVDNSKLKFGKTQKPALEDYADKVDTLSFLLNL